MSKGSYHIQFFGPLKNEYVDWPAGACSVYQINGDQIAQRIIMEPGTSNVIERHPWCGFLGCFNSLAEAAKAIEAAEA